MAFGVRVEVAQHFASARPRGTMSRDQRRRINLKTRQSVRMNVRGRVRRIDPTFRAKQQATTLFGSCPRGFVKQCVNHTTCHFDRHAHLVAVIQGESIIVGLIGPGADRLDKALAVASGMSRERVKALITEGRITLDGQKVTQPRLKAAEGSAFRIAIPQALPAEAEAQDIPLVIVYEDEHLLVVDKPAGLVVHPAAGNLDGTLVNALLHHCRGQLSGIGGVARPGIVHRIDKDTSGLLAVAKTDAAHEGLSRQFADHSIERAYLALVAGHPVPLAGTVRGSIARSSVNRKKMAMVEEGRGKHAVTHFRTLERLELSALVECRLETGRTHQVRVHMTSIGHPLLGDPVYGRTPARLRPILTGLEFGRQALHARELGFVHPVSGVSLRFSSELPVDMAALLEELRG